MRRIIVHGGKWSLTATSRASRWPRADLVFGQPQPTLPQIFGGAIANCKNAHCATHAEEMGEPDMRATVLGIFMSFVISAAAAEDVQRLPDGTAVAFSCRVEFCKSTLLKSAAPGAVHNPPIGLLGAPAFRLFAIHLASNGGGLVR
jgi:hypothetical protein